MVLILKTPHLHVNLNLACNTLLKIKCPKTGHGLVLNVVTVTFNAKLHHLPKQLHCI